MKQVSDTAAGTARPTPRNLKPAATGQPQNSDKPRRARRSRKTQYVTEVEHLDTMDQSEILFDVVAVARTPELQRRLDRAIQSCGETPATWLNKQVIAGVEGDEDPMVINARGMVLGYSGKWFPNPKACEEKESTPSLAEQLVRIEKELGAEIWSETEHGGPNDGKVTCPDALHRIACFEATRAILISLQRPRTYIVRLDSRTATQFGNASMRLGVSVGEMIGGAACLTGHTNGETDTELDPDNATWLVEYAAQMACENAVDPVTTSAPFVVSNDLISRATILAKLWEIDPNRALENISLLWGLMAKPWLATDWFEEFCDGDAEKEKRVRARLADLVRAADMGHLELENHQEVWARIIQFGRLPWDDGHGWDDRARAIEAYMTAPTHQP